MGMLEAVSRAPRRLRKECFLTQCQVPLAKVLHARRMQPLLHRFSKRIERAARAEAAAEAAEAAALEEAAFLAGSSDDSSGDEAPLVQRKPEAGAPSKTAAGPSKQTSQPPKGKSKLKLKLKVGGVSFSWHPLHWNAAATTTYQCGNGQIVLAA